MNTRVHVSECLECGIIFFFIFNFFLASPFSLMSHITLTAHNLQLTVVRIIRVFFVATMGLMYIQFLLVQVVFSCPSCALFVLVCAMFDVQQNIGIHSRIRGRLQFYSILLPLFSAASHSFLNISFSIFLFIFLTSQPALPFSLLFLRYFPMVFFPFVL